MSNFPDVNILLVEDDEIDVRVVKKAIADQRIINPLFVASDGVEALEMLRGEGGRERVPQPYMILLDLKMPRMNGIQFLEAIRDDPELRTSVVFVLTTSDDDRDKLAAYEKNVAGYLLKQDVGDGFMNAIRMLDLFAISVHFPPNSVEAPVNP
jgi:CheY-like chemotaxis protein